MSKFKYLGAENIYKEDAFLALCEQFSSRHDFEDYYSRIATDAEKNEFLRASAAYLFFVKNGDWTVNVPRSNPVIEYFTNSFKLVALLGIVESLSQEKFVEFPQWLKKRENGFPIEDSAQLDSLSDAYKADFGAIRRCKHFFRSLPGAVQAELCQCIKVDGNPLQSIDKFAELLYQARSGFAHDVSTTTEFSGNHFGKYRGKLTVWKLPIEKLLSAFETGLINRFNHEITKT